MCRNDANAVRFKWRTAHTDEKKTATAVVEVTLVARLQHVTDAVGSITRLLCHIDGKGDCLTLGFGCIKESLVALRIRKDRGAFFGRCLLVYIFLGKLQLFVKQLLFGLFFHLYSPSVAPSTG